MSRRGSVLLSWAVCLALASTTKFGIAQCAGTAIQQSEKQSVVAAPEYAKQIQLARQAALEVYDHGFLGNSGSAINNKVGRPPGMSVAVAVDGKLVWAEGFGVADLEQCVPVTPKTKFRIGSTSKPLTSAAVALLYDQKRLDLDAPIRRYVPDFPDKDRIITTRQLLGHLGGIRGYNAEEGIGTPRVHAPLLPPRPTADLESASGRCARSASVQIAGKPSAFHGEYPLAWSPSSVLLPPTGRKTELSKLAPSESRRVAERTPNNEVRTRLVYSRCRRREQRGNSSTAGEYLEAALGWLSILIKEW
jgi:hypothetical protein